MSNKTKTIAIKYKNILAKKGYSKRTVEMYVHYASKFIEAYNKNPYKLNKTDLKEYLLSYNYSSNSQQNQVISSLKLFYKYMLNIKNLEYYYLERPRKEKRLPKVIDNDTLKSKIENIANLKHKAIIMLTYSVGLRVSEVINLKIEDIDSSRMIITIRQAKGKKDRIAPLSEKVLQMLRQYYKAYKPNTYLFNGQFSLQYSRTSCNNIVKKYLGQSYRFHTLRHSSFTSMLESGTDLRVIQSIAGHKSSKTTEIYTHVSTNLLHQAHLPI